MKKILIGVVGLVVLLAIAAVVAPGFVDWNSFKGQISDAARDATGREMRFDGDISFRLLPAPALSAAGVRLANVPGAEPADMVRLESLDVRVRLAPLLSGRVEVASVRLVRPVAVLERFRDGSANWDLKPAGAPPSTAGADSASGDGGMALSLDRFEIKGGKVVYRDQAAGTEEVVEGIDLEGSASALTGPFKVAGSLTARGLPLKFDLELGDLQAGDAVPLHFSAALGGGKATVDLTGRIEQPTTAPRFAGDIKAGAPDLRAAAALAGVDLPPPLAGAGKLSAKLEASATAANLNDVQMTLADTLANGAVSVGFADGIDFDVALSVGRLDLDRMLAAAAGGGKPASASAGTPAPANDGIVLPAIPTGIAGTVNLNVDGLAWRSSVIRQAHLSLAIADGGMELTRAAALLPGGSDVSLSGKARTENGATRFDGRFEMASDNLRGLLGWLDVDVGAIPGDRLNSLSVTADVALVRDLFQVAGANLRLDNVTAGGAVAVRLQSRPSFGLSLNVDRVNLDGYLPEAAPAKAAGGKPQKAATPQATASPLAALDGFDANVAIKIGQLTANGATLKGIATDLGLVRGTLTIRKASVDDLAGANLALTGTAAGFAGDPAVDVAARMTAPDLAGLARLLKLETGVPAERLTGVALSAKLKGSAADLAVDTQAEAAGARATVNGRLRDTLTAPAFDLRYDIRHASLASLSRLLDLGVVPLKGADGPVVLAGSAKGDLKALDLSVDGQAAGARLRSSGRLSGLDTAMQVDVATELVGDDVVATLRALGTDYRPALRQMGGFQLNARLTGADPVYQVAGLKGRVGPVSLDGKASARLDGPRPYVEATLATSEVIVDMFLPAGGGAASGGGATGSAAAGGERWSRERIDLSGLGAVDGMLDLSAPGLVYGNYPFVQPHLKASLSDGTLKITQLSGKLFKGTVGLQATLNSRPAPALGLGVQLAGADIKEALVAAAGIEQVSGTLGFEGSFQAAGGSTFDLVRSLNGNASVKAADGAIQGFDIKNFSAQLAELNRAGDFLALANRAFSGGQTAMKSATGTWQIENGVARTADTRAVLDASEATVTGSVDLPRWLMDLRASLALTEHPKAPPLGVHLTGPLDAPKRDVKTEEMERYLALRFGSEVLRKTLGKDKQGVGKLLDAITGSQGGGQPAQQAPAQAQPSQPQQPAPQQQQAPQPTEPQKALEGLLKGLMKR